MMDREIDHNRPRDIKHGIEVNNVGNEDISPTSRILTFEKVAISKDGPNGRKAPQQRRSSSPRGRMTTSEVFWFCFFSNSLLRGHPDSMAPLGAPCSAGRRLGSSKERQEAT
jgi:hypothetical protein